MADNSGSYLNTLESCQSSQLRGSVAPNLLHLEMQGDILREKILRAERTIATLELKEAVNRRTQKILLQTIGKVESSQRGIILSSLKKEIAQLTTLSNSNSKNNAYQEIEDLIKELTELYRQLSKETHPNNDSAKSKLEPHKATPSDQNNQEANASVKCRNCRKTISQDDLEAIIDKMSPKQLAQFLSLGNEKLATALIELENGKRSNDQKKFDDYQQDDTDSKFRFSDSNFFQNLISLRSSIDRFEHQHINVSLSKILKEENKRNRQQKLSFQPTNDPNKPISDNASSLPDNLVLRSIFSKSNQLNNLQNGVNKNEHSINSVSMNQDKYFKSVSLNPRQLDKDKKYSSSKKKGRKIQSSAHSDREYSPRSVNTTDYFLVKRSVDGNLRLGRLDKQLFNKNDLLNNSDAHQLDQSLANILRTSEDFVNNSYSDFPNKRLRELFVKKSLLNPALNSAIIKEESAEKFLENESSIFVIESLNCPNGLANLQSSQNMHNNVVNMSHSINSQTHNTKFNLHEQKETESLIQHLPVPVSHQESFNQSSKDSKKQQGSNNLSRNRYEQSTHPINDSQNNQTTHFNPTPSIDPQSQYDKDQASTEIMNLMEGLQKKVLNIKLNIKRDKPNRALNELRKSKSLESFQTGKFNAFTHKQLDDSESIKIMGVGPRQEVMETEVIPETSNHAYESKIQILSSKKELSVASVFNFKYGHTTDNKTTGTPKEPNKSRLSIERNITGFDETSLKKNDSTNYQKLLKVNSTKTLLNKMELSPPKPIGDFTFHKVTETDQKLKESHRSIASKDLSTRMAENLPTPFFSNLARTNSIQIDHETFNPKYYAESFRESVKNQNQSEVKYMDEYQDQPEESYPVEKFEEEKKSQNFLSTKRRSKDDLYVIQNARKEKMKILMANDTLMNKAAISKMLYDSRVKADELIRPLTTRAMISEVPRLGPQFNAKTFFKSQKQEDVVESRPLTGRTNKTKTNNLTQNQNINTNNQPKKPVNQINQLTKAPTVVQAKQRLSFVPNTTNLYNQNFSKEGDSRQISFIGNNNINHQNHGQPNFDSGVGETPRLRHFLSNPKLHSNGISSVISDEQQQSFHISNNANLDNSQHQDFLISNNTQNSFFRTLNTESSKGMGMTKNVAKQFAGPIPSIKKDALIKKKPDLNVGKAFKSSKVGKL